MEPKPIQDVAPPGPEISHDTPARQSIQNMSYGEGPMPSGDDRGLSSTPSDHTSEAKQLGAQLPRIDQDVKTVSKLKNLSRFWRR